MNSHKFSFGILDICDHEDRTSGKMLLYLQSFLIVRCRIGGPYESFPFVNPGHLRLLSSLSPAPCSNNLYVSLISLVVSFLSHTLEMSSSVSFHTLFDEGSIWLWLIYPLTNTDGGVPSISDSVIKLCSNIMKINNEIFKLVQRRMELNLFNQRQMKREFYSG